MLPRLMSFAAVLALAAACTTTPKPATIADVANVHDWQNSPGAWLNASYQADMTRLLKGMAPETATSALVAAQYECETGDATVCKRSFATRACQMDWDIAFPTNGGPIRVVSANYRRDCVGRDGDWPTAKDSAIDNQLATPPKPAF